MHSPVHTNKTVKNPVLLSKNRHVMLDTNFDHLWCDLFYDVDGPQRDNW